MDAQHDGWHDAVPGGASEDGVWGSRKCGGVGRDAEAQVGQGGGGGAALRTHFSRAGCSPSDSESRARKIDRPFLTDQRRAWGGVG